MTETNEKIQIEKRQTGYIYSIRSYQTELIYIGSTFGTLRQRLFKHKQNFKNFKLQKYGYTSSYEIVKYDDAFVELVKTCKNVNKMELQKFEGEHIRKNKCVNLQITGQTDKEYREINKDKIKQYNETHRDEQKKYREINKDKIHKYYEDNKIKMKEYNKERHGQKYICECGKSLSTGNKTKHIKVCKAIIKS